MTNIQKDSEDELEKLRMENELKKMKIILENNAMFFDPPNENPIDPYIENEFLSNIEAFEKNHTNAQRILLYDFIGRPVYREVEAIPDSQISSELEKMMDALQANEIQLDTLCEVDDRELYRFITQELFIHEMDNMRVKGMMCCFIYEEFHPNHAYDIRNHSTDFIESFLNKETDFYTNSLTKEAEENQWYRNFREAFEFFVLKHFEIIDLQFEDENASVRFEIDFTGTTEGNGAKQRYKGEGTIELIYQYDYWCVQDIVFPTPD
jgi:hypothetical protein